MMTNACGSTRHTAQWPQFHTGVKRWMDLQARQTLFTTSVCEAEILTGMALLPAGRRRNPLEAAV